MIELSESTVRLLFWGGVVGWVSAFWMTVFFLQERHYYKRAIKGWQDTIEDFKSAIETNKQLHEANAELIRRITDDQEGEEWKNA